MVDGDVEGDSEEACFLCFAPRFGDFVMSTGANPCIQTYLGCLHVRRLGYVVLVMSMGALGGHKP